MSLAVLLQSVAAKASADPLAEATALNEQAAALYRQGHYAEAEPMLRRALAIREKALAPNDPSLALSLNNLAELYRAQGRYDVAEPLHKRALAIRERARAPNNPDLAQSLNNLALLYQDQGRYPEAEPLHKRALAIREKALGPNDPELAQSLNNLALLYREQSREDEAEPLLKRALAIREKTLGPGHPDFAANLTDLAELYRAQGREGEAEPLLKRALAIRQKAFGSDHPDIAQSLNNLAQLYSDQGRYPEAEPLYHRFLVIYEKVLGPDHPYVATSLVSLAELYWKQGRYSEAEPLLKRAMAIREKALGPDHPSFANALNSLAVLYLDQARYAEAEPLLKRALAIREKAFGPDHTFIATELNNLGELYVKQRRYAEAEPLYKRALAIREKTLAPDHPELAVSLNNLAGLYRTQARYTEAELLLKRALSMREKIFGTGHPILAQSLNNLAVLYLDDGQPDRALPASARAVQIMMNHLSIGSRQRSGAVVFEQHVHRDYFTNYIVIADAVAGKSPDRSRAVAADTIRVAQLAQASSTANAVAGAAARLMAGGGSRSAMIRERQDLVQEWQRLDGAIVKAASRAPPDRRPADEESLRASLEDATRRLDALDARIAAEFPAYADLSNPKPLPAEAAQALLGSDEALLVYLITDEATWLWVLRRDDLAYYHLDIAAKTLTDEVTALRASLDPKSNPGLAPFPAKRAHALYRKLIGPAEPMLAGVHHLLIVPDGALQSLPMTVLVTKPPQQDSQSPEDNREIAWLARDYAVTVLPAVSSLRALRQFANADHASAAFLGIGDPVLTGSSALASAVTLVSLFRGATADVEKVRQLPPLPETADELRAIAKTLGASDADLLLGERASEPVLRQMPLDHYKIIEFATHGLMSGELKGLAEPALVLTPPSQATLDDDGLLTASKIATLKLNADWVVLSACNTAAGDGTPDAGGLSGLAKAFFYAGARSLLVSHWPVQSDAAVKLTTDAFAELSEDPTIGRAEALRRSMMAMLDPANSPKFAHPLYWAPFVLAGEGGAGR